MPKRAPGPALAIPFKYASFFLDIMHVLDLMMSLIIVHTMLGEATGCRVLSQIAGLKTAQNKTYVIKIDSCDRSTQAAVRNKITSAHEQVQTVDRARRVSRLLLD